MEFELEKDRAGNKRHAFKVRVMNGEFIDQDGVRKMHLWAQERFERNYVPCILQGSNSYQHAFRFTKENEAAMFIMRWQYASTE